METYNVSVINSWTRGTKSITLPAGTYIIGQRSDVNCSNSIYLDTRIDTFKQDLPLYEKALNIPTTTARNDVTEYRSCNNTFAMGFSKETTLYFFCWADSPITIQYEIWAIKIKRNSDLSVAQSKRYLLLSGTNQSGIKLYIDTRDERTSLCFSYNGNFFGALLFDNVNKNYLPPNPGAYD